MPQRRRKFSPQFKAEALQMVVETGRPIAEVARALGVVAQTLGNWVTAWRDAGLLRWPGNPSAEETGRVIDSKSGLSAPAGYRFPREVIAVAVRWCLRYGLSYRDVEELSARARRHCRSRHHLPLGTDLHFRVDRHRPPGMLSPIQFEAQAALVVA